MARDGLASPVKAPPPSAGPAAAAAPERETEARGLAVGFVSLALLTAVKLSFSETIGGPTPFLLYFGAVLLASWHGGVRAGIATTVLGAILGNSLFIEPPLHFSLSASALAQTALFGVEGLVIASAVGRLRIERLRSSVAALEAKAALDKLNVVLAGVEDGITVQDATGRLIYANQAAARLSGFESPEALLSAKPETLMSRYQVFNEDGSPFPLDQLPARVLFRGGTAKEQLLRFRMQGRGRDQWSIVRANAVRDESGGVRFAVNVIRDVTERRRQEEEIRLNRERFSTALRSIGDAVITTDPEGTVTFLNPAAEELTGCTGSVFAGRHLRDVFTIVHETTRTPVESPVERALREGTVVGLANHTVLVRPDGTEVPIDDSAAPIRGESGELLGVVLVFRDVSQKRREEQRRDFLVRATEELGSSLDYRTTLATVAKLAVPTIADWSAVDMLEDGKIRRLAIAHVDPAKIELVAELDRRYPTDENALSGVPNIIRTGQPEIVPHILPEMLDAAARDEEHRRLIDRLELRSYMGVPMKRGDKVIGALTFAMAESHRAYDAEDLALATALADHAAMAVDNAQLFGQVQESRAQAELANRSKDEFLAMLGHELRNPLAPILSALQLMSLRAGDAFERERQIIDRQVQHVVRLVDDLLDISRITQGKIELTKGPVAISDVVSKALEIAGPLIERREHQVSVSVEPGLFVEGDSMRLAQVVANLLNNAAKYTEKGGHISIRGERVQGELRLSVSDDGIGIAPEMLPQVFDRFVQERQALDRSQGGLGLGLAIVKSLVELHGGTVEAASAGPGKGSEFVIRLPALESHRPRAVVTPPRLTKPKRNPALILIVDDNADALEMLGDSVELLGHETLRAADGPSALVVAAEQQPSLALLDIGLPVMDGYELARQLRATEGLDRIRLVAITGYGQQSDLDRSAAAGFDAHLVKPVSLDSLESIIDRLAAL